MCIQPTNVWIYIIGVCSIYSVIQQKGSNVPSMTANTTILQGEQDLVREVLQYQADSKNLANETALHLACQDGHLAVVRMLLTEFGADINARDDENETPLNKATLGGHIDVVEALISEFGCSANTRGYQDRTLLHQACAKGHLKLARKLTLQYNIPVNSQDSKKQTPLHHSCGFGYIAVTRMLLTECGADINAQDNQTNTPLNKAALGGHTDVVEALISEFGCSVNTRGYKDRTLLHQACAKGHLELARKLTLQYNIPVDSKDSEKGTPLHLSCNFGHLAITRVLLTEFGADINAEDYQNNTALSTAALGGHIDVVEALISEFGCSANTRGYEDRTLLHQACDKGHLVLARKLILQYSIPVDSKDSEKRTPLHLSCGLGHLAVTRMLLTEFGANINARDNQNSKPLDKAALGGHIDVVEALISEFGCSANTRGFRDRTLLHQACDKGHLELARKLILQDNIPVDSQDSKKEAPLHLSCYSGHLAVTRMLLTEFGADINPKDDQNDTPLNNAALQGHIDIVEALISEFGCSANTKGFRDQTLLHQVCAKGHVELARKLTLQYNIPVDSQDSKKQTPLHLSCFFGHLAVTRMLLTEFVADSNARDDDNDTPLNIAAIGGHIDILEALISEFGCSVNTKGFRDQTLLHQVCAKGHVELARKLTSQYNIPVDSQDSKKRTPLHLSCYFGHLAVTRMLLTECGADINARNHQNNTPLDMAALGGHVNVVEALISEFGCSANSRGYKNMTILHHACEKGHTHLVEALLSEHNWFVLAVNEDGNTPLHIASMFNHSAIVEKLLFECNAPVFFRNKNGNTAKEVSKSEAVSNKFNVFLKQRASQVQSEYEQLQSLSKKRFSSGSLTRVFVVGYPQAGKSSLIEALKSSDKFYFFKKRLTEGDVSPHTAGIIPSIYQGKNNRNLLFFDFAGDAEYYSSHAAILERLSVTGSNNFLIVVDLREKTETIIHKLGYWLSFISYHSKNPAARAKIVIIGSHIDILHSEGLNPANKLKHLNRTGRKFCDGTPCIELHGTIELDCCSFQVRNLRRLQEKINHISQNAPTAHLSEVASILLGLIDRDFKEVTTCTISTLLEHIRSTGIHLPKVGSELLAVTQELQRVGLLMIIRAGKVEDSLLVLDISNLTKEVHERLFSKEALTQLSSGVHGQCEKYLGLGILPESALQDIIPKHVSKECLLQLQYCHEVDRISVFQDCPVDQTISTDVTEQLLFFPALLQLQREDVSWANQPNFNFSKGWYLKCTGTFDYFPPRFLHILLLRLAFQFAPSAHLPSTAELPKLTHFPHTSQACEASNRDISPSSVSESEEPILSDTAETTEQNSNRTDSSACDIHTYNRRCHMWKSGIHWLMEEGVECFVEVVKECKGVVVVVRSEEDCAVECDSVFIAIVQKVLDTKTEFCHSITPETYLLSPEELNQSFLPDVDQLHLFAMREVESVLLENKNRVVSVDGSRFLVPESLAYMKNSIFWSK